MHHHEYVLRGIVDTCRGHAQASQRLPNEGEVLFVHFSEVDESLWLGKAHPRHIGFQFGLVASSPRIRHRNRTSTPTTIRPLAEGAKYADSAPRTGTLR